MLIDEIILEPKLLGVFPNQIQRTTRLEPSNSRFIERMIQHAFMHRSGAVLDNQFQRLAGREGGQADDRQAIVFANQIVIRRIGKREGRSPCFFKLVS